MGSLLLDFVISLHLTSKIMVNRCTPIFTLFVMKRRKVIVSMDLFLTHSFVACTVTNYFRKKMMSFASSSTL